MKHLENNNSNNNISVVPLVLLMTGWNMKLEGSTHAPTTLKEVEHMQHSVSVTSQECETLSEPTLQNNCPLTEKTSDCITPDIII